jgi:hypothetical protein
MVYTEKDSIFNTQYSILNATLLLELSFVHWAPLENIILTTAQIPSLVPWHDGTYYTDPAKRKIEY